ALESAIEIHDSVGPACTERRQPPEVGQTTGMESLVESDLASGDHDGLVARHMPPPFVRHGATRTAEKAVPVRPSAKWDRRKLIARKRRQTKDGEQGPEAQAGEQGPQRAVHRLSACRCHALRAQNGSQPPGCSEVPGHV